MKLASLNELSRAHWQELTREEQAKAVCDLIDAGHTEHTVAHATGLSVEMVRQIVSARPGAPKNDRSPTG